MKTGERFKVDGFDTVAAIEYADETGRVLVMHNNSSHLHVAVQGHDEDLDANKWAVLMASFPYFMEEGDYKVAYRYALRLACDIAVKR